MIIILLLLLSVLLLSFSLGCLLHRAFGLLCDRCYWGLVPGARGWVAGCTGHSGGSSTLGCDCDCSPWAPGHPTFICDLSVKKD